MFPLLANAFVFAFIACCIVSAVLQIIAWSKHAKEGVPVSIRALWRPEGHFDEKGLRQIHLARRLLTAGGMAYLGYGAMLLLASIGAGG